jgi:hypothetical protein
MTWTSYRVCLRVLSPIHIGWRKTGNLQQTRPYVTGKTLWGALTARLVRDRGENKYQEIGAEVDEKLRFTYFYPSTISDKVELWPWDNPDWFSWVYLGSYASTAIEEKTAEEGTLHETEYIAPRTRDGKALCLIGYIIEKEGCELNWREALKRIQIGGERGYGWGRIELIDEPKEEDTCFDCDHNGTGSSPQLTIPKDSPILAHTLADAFECIGRIETLVGRETTEKNGFGGSLSKAEVCWTPGSVVKRERVFVISEKGIWKYKKMRA